MTSFKAALLGVLMSLAMSSGAPAAVRVLVGPTPIPGGEANAKGDITVMNDRLAFALAVGSPVPYGVPKGAIIDVAAVQDGKIGQDHAVFADFIPNNWSAWPNTYQRVEIVERGPGRAVIRAVRDFGQATITTVYTLKDGADVVELSTTMENEGAVPLHGLLSGPTLWPEGGFLFGVPGLAGDGPVAGKAMADRVVAYDQDWSIALHAPGFGVAAYGSKDLYRQHDLAPGESRTFEGRLQVGPRGDLAPVIREEVAHGARPAETVKGVVRDRRGKLVSEPVVVIERDGKPYGWAFGRGGAYDLTLPVGTYSLYATAKGHSQSAPATVSAVAGRQTVLDFADVGGPGTVRFAISDGRGGPLDARIVIAEGQKPLVEFLGKKTFFTELDRKGAADVALAPGDYLFDVSSSGGFLSESSQVRVTVASGATLAEKVALPPLFDPPTAKGWYAADLHHHADKAEASTPPADLARSQLAAGLDLLFVSDHDTSANHGALQAIADHRKIGFIPSIELSASWGHFNAFPLKPGLKLEIDTGTATSSEIFAEARRQGAVVVQANHPFIPYGYLASVKAGAAPGGFDPRFELLEINAAIPTDDAKVLKALADLWNGGHRYYLSGGTDVHDVWNDLSGRVRTFAHVDGPVTALAYAEALKAGHAYVSAGPLIYPSVMFGDALKARPGEAISLAFDLQSVAGLKSAKLMSNDGEKELKTFADGPRETRATFALTATKPAWYALVVEDAKGWKAYANPIWVDVVTYPAVVQP